jgi:hypothetical protein
MTLMEAKILSIPEQHNCDYLIITPDIFLSGATWNTALINLQISRGFHPQIEIISNYTTITQIQNIIADFYNDNRRNLQYVLLIGSAKDITNSIPIDTSRLYKFQQNNLTVKMVEYENKIYIPFFSVHCDAYWSSTGTDIATDDPYTANLTNNGPVYLGRVPVNSVTEINNYVSKLQTYYQNSGPNSPYNNHEILLNLDVDCHANGCTGALVRTITNDLENKHIPRSVSITELNVSEHTPDSAFTYSFARQNLFINALNSGAAVISILGTNWSRDDLVSWFYSKHDFSNLNNKNTAMPFLIGTSCSAGGVNNPDTTLGDNGIRALMVYPNGGIIGSIAPTSFTEQHINGDVLNLFHDLILQQPTLTYGQIFPILKNYIAVNFPAWTFYYKSLIFFGDPSMNSWKLTPLTLNLTALIEAMYVPGGTAMTMAPLVTVELHSASSPYALIESQTGILSTVGVGTFNFTTVGIGQPVYIVFKYCNTIETWSAYPCSFTNGSLSYDFSISQNQAYGGNLIQVGSKWCIYSGDVNQDGYVDSGDLELIDADYTNYLYGPGIVTDLDGNGEVDSGDVLICDNNYTNYIYAITPLGSCTNQVKKQIKTVDINKL